MPQLAFNFGAINHLSAIHSKHNAGVAFSRLSIDNWLEFTAIQYNQAVEFCREIEGVNDSYMAVNAIRPFAKRCFESVTYLTSHFVDLDFYTLNIPLDVALAAVCERCDKLELPRPTMIIDSGRGAYAVWEFKSPVYCGSKAGDKASKRKFAWQDTQKNLISIFADLGADPKCRDVARVLRVVGSKNSKSNRSVQCCYLGDSLKSAVSFSKRLKSITGTSAREKQNKPVTGESRRYKTVTRGNVTAMLNARTLNHARTEDLRKLAELRGGRLKDNRAMAIFYYGMAASYLNVSVEGVCRSVSSFMHECIDTQGSTKYDANRPEKLLGTLLARHGNKGSDFETRPYTARNQTIINALGITDEEQRHLKTIISKEEKYRRKNEARNAKNRKSGMIARDEYEANSLLKTKPWEEMGVTRMTWYRWRARGKV